MSVAWDPDELYNSLQSLDSHVSTTESLVVPELAYLDRISSTLAKSSELRSSLGTSSSPIWPILSSIWQQLCVADPHVPHRTVLSIAKLTRNACPNCAENQEKIFEFEPRIREITFQYTSYLLTEDKDSHIVARTLVQTLSNMVTSNEALISRLWSVYCSLPDEQNVLIRVLGHPDKRTVISGLVLIANCTSGNKHRLNQLITSGTRLCIVLLDLLAKEVDEGETDDQLGDVFEIGWSIVSDAFHHGLAPELFSSTSVEGEIVAPHQTTLVKVLDAYLLHHDQAEEEHSYEFLPLLTAKFFELSSYTCHSIRNMLDINASVATITDDPDQTQPLQQLDVLLPKVCQAIGLVTQCLCTLALGNQRIYSTAERSKRYVIDATSQGMGLIERLIDLLRDLDRFLPRIILGKASFSDGRQAPMGGPDLTGFNHLKRDLVRLLGILCYEERAVQDRIRLREGITVVMNLCVTDERNPYLREHALFTLRNLLLGNEENQSIVDSIKPLGTWDKDGQLRDGVGVRR